ncbi:MAG TPA: lysophospholipid acyltransferase family protein [Chthoniobacteraceae bacterium]|nr:lysophospholipid acyltransferase family protein [Chthoniobacteraceae bacterium]
MNLYYQTGWNIFKFLGNLFFSFRAVHPERIPLTGPAVLAMNHQSFLDPPLAGICTQRELHILARNSLLKWPVVGKLMPKVNVVPVDRSGGDMAALKAIIRVIKANEAVLLFPEGTRSRTGALQKAQPGIGFVIAKTLTPVIPMRIFGAHEALPPDGKSFSATPVTVVVGEPLYFTQDDIASRDRDLYQRLSDRVMDAIAAIEYVA